MNRTGAEHIKGKTPRQREGLPCQAFAIAGDKDDTSTWKLPHHTRSIWRALRGGLDLEKTVDWNRMNAAVAALSPGGYRGRQVEATAAEKKKAAVHLAGHYRKAGRDVPETLAHYEH
jgi:hypothetical protein